MSRLHTFLSGLVIAIIPFFLLMTAIRLVINPIYAQIEYNMPNFPEDPFGFTKQDRLLWSRYSIDYLLNNAGISYLADLHLPDGQPLYNERELSHMLDVKKLVKAMIAAWWILLVVLVGLGIWAWRGKWLSKFWRGVSNGGWATIGLILLMLVFVLISFQSLFTDFHRIFFSGDTWIFEYSDSLIRLFPLPFWQDAFIFVGAFTIVFALLCGFLGRRWARLAPQ